MMLSFYLFVILVVCMAIISLTDRDKIEYEIPAPIHEGWSKLAIGLWIALAVVMVGLYIFFNEQRKLSAYSDAHHRQVIVRFRTASVFRHRSLQGLDDLTTALATNLFHHSQ